MPVTGGTTGVPVDVTGVSANLDVLRSHRSRLPHRVPRRLPPPPTSNVNFAAGRPSRTPRWSSTNAAAVEANTVNVFMSTAGHVIIDVNGYFVAAPI